MGRLISYFLRWKLPPTLGQKHGGLGIFEPPHTKPGFNNVMALDLPCKPFLSLVNSAKLAHCNITNQLGSGYASLQHLLIWPIQTLATILHLHRDQWSLGALARSPTGQYTPRLTYQFLINPGIRVPTLSEIWNMKVLPKIKIFIWLLFHNKLQTANNLQKNGWPAIITCALCAHTLFETSSQLFLHCPVARSMWTSITNLPNPPSIKAAWIQARSNSKEQMWAVYLWLLWKERNNRLFQGTKWSLTTIRGDIIYWGNNWVKYCWD